VTRVAAFAALAVVVGCTAGAATPPRSAQPPLPVSASPSASPRYEPGPDFVVGTITRVVAGGLVIQTISGEITVTLAGVRSVWKETEVLPSELEVSDQIDVNGLRVGASFDARYVSANIGRFDGLVVRVVGNKLELVELPPSTRVFEVELSPYLQVVRNADIPAAVADLKPGMSVGGVVYRPKNAPRRATKIWF
jgi:hypothetical protein